MEKIALIISILGIFILISLVILKEPGIKPISSIAKEDIDKLVKINGEIINIKTYDSNFTIITIKDSTGSINAICTYNKENLTKNKTIEIIGKIQEYEKELQINIEKIKKSD